MEDGRERGTGEEVERREEGEKESQRARGQRAARDNPIGGEGSWSNLCPPKANNIILV